MPKNTQLRGFPYGCAVTPRWGQQPLAILQLQETNNLISRLRDLHPTELARARPSALGDVWSRGQGPAPTLPPEAATFCSMDYPPTAPMSTEVCPRLPHSGMISQETTGRCYALYMEGEKRVGVHTGMWVALNISLSHQKKG